MHVSIKHFPPVPLLANFLYKLLPYVCWEISLLSFNFHLELGSQGMGADG